MQLMFQEVELTRDFERLGMVQLFEVEKFPFKIRIGRVPRGYHGDVFYWTILGTYITPHVALTHGKEGNRLHAEDQACKALEGLLLDVREWIEYAMKINP